MFVVSLIYTASLAKIDASLEAHVAYLDRHYANGNFLLSGRKLPRTGGVILAAAASRAELYAILAEDPFYKAGLASYESTEFVPSKAMAGLDFLLS